MTSASGDSSTSARYDTLRDELSLLSTHLLPHERDPIGDYPPQVYTCENAYQVLAHAEFESYFEDRVKDLCIWSVQQWKLSQAVSKVTVSLLSYHSPFLKMGGQGSKPVMDAMSITSRIDDANKRFHRIIKDNHGIRERDIITLLFSRGITSEDIDTGWLATLDSFGISRGWLAHQSASVHRLQSLLDPFSIKGTVDQILDGITELDLKLNKLRSQTLRQTNRKPLQLRPRRQTLHRPWPRRRQGAGGARVAHVLDVRRGPITGDEP